MLSPVPIIQHHRHDKSRITPKNRQYGKLLERWNATYNWLECGHPALVTGLVLEKYPAKSKGWLLAQWVVGLEFEVNLWRTRLTEVS